jgi:hypothetical protein
MRLQLDFGANRVVLVRNAATRACLPEAIRSSNAVIMEVAASKGALACCWLAGQRWHLEADYT